MKIFRIALFLFIFGLLIPNRLLVSIVSWGKQSLFIIPLALLFIFSFKLPQNRVLRHTLLLFVAVMIFQLIRSYGGGFISFYNYIGVLMIPLIIAALYINKYDYTIHLSYYLIFSSAIVIAFYLGLWYTYSDGRKAFAGDNPNLTSNLLLIGAAISLYFMVINEAVTKKWMYFGLAVLHAVPIYFTFSRTGIIVLVIIFLNTFFYMGRARFILNSIFIGVILSFAITYQVLEFSNIKGVNFVMDRFGQATEHTERAVLWEAATAEINKNLLLGVGLKDYNDPEWKIEHGLSGELFSTRGPVTVAASVHNSFLELLLLGGIPLFLLYTFIIFYIAYKSFRYLAEFKFARPSKIFLLTFNFFWIILFFSLTGQASYQKHTWWMIGLCFLFFDKIERDKLIVQHYYKNQEV